jgi:peptidoglycan/xylan/chitin deacetylase (PgdA/CDA1 family)
MSWPKSTIPFSRKPFASQAKAFLRQWWGPNLTWRDFASFAASPPRFGVVPGEPLARLGITADELIDAHGPVRFCGITRYLNGAKAVVSHSIDDTTEWLPACLDVMDRYGIKSTVFVTTQFEPLMSSLWPRLRQAISDGHEIGSHSRRHPCRVPDSLPFCLGRFTNDEIEGSREDILRNTGQPHVWSWAYPCGNCADRKFVQRKIARARYVAARAYPGEFQNRHAVPNLQSYDPNPYAARYTQIVQKGYSKKGGRGQEFAISGRTDLAALNDKFDEVLAAGGIYSFVSHPQMLDYGPDSFYERHLAHVGGRADVWYVPMGPLYAYRTLSAQTIVRQLRPTGAATRFAVYNSLDPKIYNGSITLEFHAPTPTTAIANGKKLTERASQPVTRWGGEYFRCRGQNILVTVQPNTLLEFL